MQPDFLLVQCALNADGTLKDTSEIKIFNDVDDTTPITSMSWISGMDSFPILLVNSNCWASCAGRSRDKAQMTEIIDAELDTTMDDTKVVQKCKRKTKAKEMKSDKEDDDFVGSSGHSDSTSDGKESDSVGDHSQRGKWTSTIYFAPTQETISSLWIVSLWKWFLCILDIQLN